MAGKTTSTTKRRAKRRTVVPFTWRDFALKITVTEDCWAPGQTHLELSLVKPKGAPLPLTSTGYFSHYVNAELLSADGGAIAYFTAWLDREARTKTWHTTEFRWRQGELFGKPKR
jgi:hypothetical protein